MTNLNSSGAPLAAAVLASAIPSQAAEGPSLDSFLAKIKDKNDAVRGPAWQSAADYGAPAIKPLAAIMHDPEMEIARAAKRALWKIVRRAGRPDAAKERSAVTKELVALLPGETVAVRREVLWMLSEIGGKAEIAPIAAVLSDRELREDARAALERIPGNASIAALKEALRTVSDDFKPAVAQSLRVRGVKVEGFPSQKLVPTRPHNAMTPKAA